MLFLDQLSWSWRHSKRQLFESILIILAIALGVGVIVTVLSLLLSVNREFGNMRDQDYFRTFQVISREDIPMYGRGGTPIVLLGEELPDERWSVGLSEIEALQNNLPETMYVFVEDRWPGETPLLDGEELPEELAQFSWLQANEITFIGVLPAYFPFKGLELAHGNFFLPEDVQKESPVVVITDKLATSLFGEADPLGKEIPINFWEDEATYTVIGVLAPPETEEYGGVLAFEQSRNAYAPVTTSPWGRNEEGEREFPQISIGVDKGVDLVLAQERVEGEIRLLWGEDVLLLSTLQDFLESQESLKRYALIIGVFASLGLVIAVINILNLMLARVLKRTKSIGLSIALGSSRALVFRQFISEASLLGIIGSGLGILFSFGLGVVLKGALGAELMPTMAETRILFGAILGLLISLLFGAYPAYLAAKTDPVDALRTD